MDGKPKSTGIGDPTPEGEPKPLQQREGTLEERRITQQLVTMAQQGFAPWRELMMEQQAFPNSDVQLAASMAMFCGAIIGELAGQGIIRDCDMATTLDAMRKNIEQGVSAGRKHVVRVAEVMLAEDAKAAGKPS